MLTDDDAALRLELQAQLSALAPYFRRQKSYYEGKASLWNLGISIPQGFQNFGVTASWPATVVDVPAERIRWRGWDSPDVEGLAELGESSAAGFEIGQMVKESMLFGQGFCEVVDSDDGPVVQALPAETTTGVWSPLKRRLEAAFTTYVAGGEVWEKLFTEEATVTLCDGDVVDEWVHGFGRPTVARLANRQMPYEASGRSEITAEIRYFTDAATRTLLEMEVAREFFTMPQRWALNVAPEQFGIDPEAPPEVKKMQGWQATMANIWAIPPTPSGDTVQMGEFSSQGPASFWESIRGYSRLCASAAGMPESYFGFVTDNPTSADAIRAGESRLVRRAEAKVAQASVASNELARIAVMTRDGVGEVPGIRSSWDDVATPTKAAAADAAVKLVGAGILPPESQVTRDFVGLSAEQQATLRTEDRGSAARSIIDLVQSRTPSPEAVAAAQRTQAGR